MDLRLGLEGDRLAKRLGGAGWSRLLETALENRLCASASRLCWVGLARHELPQWHKCLRKESVLGGLRLELIVSSATKYVLQAPRTYGVLGLCAGLGCPRLALLLNLARGVVGQLGDVLWPTVSKRTGVSVQLYILSASFLATVGSPPAV